jgi:pimeloyl-ACP methyl ester carboxylesterase
MESTSATTTYHRVTVDGIGVFYREAGPKGTPTILFPGFGHIDVPPPSSYAYTFDNLAKTTNDLLEHLEIDKCTFYLHDYGGPVGFRIFLAHPERVKALIIQNANAYAEGIAQYSLLPFALDQKARDHAVQIYSCPVSYWSRSTML